MNCSSKRETTLTRSCATTELTVWSEEAGRGGGRDEEFLVCCYDDSAECFGFSSFLLTHFHFSSNSLLMDGWWEGRKKLSKRDENRSGGMRRRWAGMNLMDSLPRSLLLRLRSVKLSCLLFSRLDVCFDISSMTKNRFASALLSQGDAISTSTQTESDTNSWIFSRKVERGRTGTRK